MSAVDDNEPASRGFIRDQKEDLIERFSAAHRRVRESLEELREDVRKYSERTDDNTTKVVVINRELELADKNKERERRDEQHRQDLRVGLVSLLVTIVLFLISKIFKL